MSYILDALRRADAERDRGTVPGLHTKPFTPSSQAVTASSAPSRWSLKYMGMAALGLALLAAYMTWGRSSNVETPIVPIGQAPSPVTTPPVALPASPTAPMQATAPPPSNPAVAARVDRPAAATNGAVPVAAPPRPSDLTRPAAPNTPAASPRVAAAPARAPSTQPVSPPSTSPSPAEATAGDERLPNRNELPAELQRLLPALAMSGSVYSPQARGRMVIVDGKLAFEGDEVMPGIVVERILPKAVVMRVQQQRFRVPL